MITVFLIFHSRSHSYVLNPRALSAYHEYDFYFLLFLLLLERHIVVLEIYILSDQKKMFIILKRDTT